MEESRLASLSPELVAAFDAAAPATQRAVLHEACIRAVNSAELNDDQTLQALALIQSGGKDEALADAIDERSEEFDERYFEIEDEDSPEAAEWFVKARATAALVLGVSADPDADDKDALYEALFAAEDADAAVEEFVAKLKA